MKKQIILLVKVAITIGVFGYLIKKIDFNDIDFQFAHNFFLFITLALLVVIFQSLVAASKWHIVLKIIHIPHNIKNILQIFWVSIFINTFLPAGIGGDIARIWLTKSSAQIPLNKAINSVMMDRVASLYLLLVVIVASFLTTRQLAGIHMPTKALVVILVGSLIGMALLALFYFLPVLKKYKNNIDLFISQLTLDFFKLIGSLKSASIVFFIAAIGLFLQILAVYLTGLAFNANIPLSSYIAIMPLVILTSSLPISLGGWGVREGLMVVLFSHLNTHPAIILSTSITYGCIAIIVSLPGGLMWSINRWKLSKQDILVPANNNEAP